ncbi:MAG: S49 family peptidase [Chlamydiota bacterium]|nr:S49 family peptidase [Chlamydiota bacterium]
MKHSFIPGVVYGSLRAFFMALMATVGIAFGIILFTVIIGGISSTSTKDVDRDYKVQILPNAEGVRTVESKNSPVILQINVNGVIGTELLSQDTIREQLVESREGDLKKDRVKAILLNINTPGGTVVDSDGIYRAVKAYKEQYKIPVYAYVDGICASGGMYVASAADKVYANDVSLIGSVGVIGPSFMNFSELIDKFGIKSLTISEGKGKDAMNPLRPWKPEEDAMYRDVIKYYYGMFVDIVTEARPEIGKENLIEKYGAKVFPAEVAKTHGFIDGSNYSRSEVLKLLLKEIGISDSYYQVVQLQNTNWISRLFTNKNSFLQGVVKHKLDLPHEISPELTGKFLYLYRPGL